ncbi:MAG TPA: hypothetical protein VIP48_06230 [Streptosporangiaceae bacterium]
MSLVNNNMRSVPVADMPWAGAFAAAPGACLPMGVPVLLGPAELPVTARPRVIAGGLAQRRGQTSVQAKPGIGQQGTSVKTYTHAMSAAATGGSQTGSLPAWDPV